MLKEEKLDFYYLKFLFFYDDVLLSFRLISLVRFNMFYEFIINVNNVFVFLSFPLS